MLFTIYINNGEITGVAYDKDGIRYCTHDIRPTFGKKNEYNVISSNKSICDGGTYDWEVLCKEWEHKAVIVNITPEKQEPTTEYSPYDTHIIKFDISEHI